MAKYGPNNNPFICPHWWVGPEVDVIKFFLEEILISPKLRNYKTFVLMSEPAQKCENKAISSKTMHKNCLLLLKRFILAVFA